MTDTRQLSPGEYRPSRDGGFTVVSVEPYTRRDGSPSQLIRWRGACTICRAPYEVTGGGNVEKLAKTCEQHRGMRRPKPGRRPTPTALLRCIRSMLKLAIRRLSEGNASGALDTLRNIEAMLAGKGANDARP